MKYVAYNVENVARCHEFETREEAQAFADKMNDRWQKFRDMTGIRFAVATPEEYSIALDAFKADIQRREEAQKLQERQEFAQYMQMLVKKNEQEIAAMEAIIPVCRKFDGKVLNVRFEKAMNEACGDGWYCHVGYDGAGLKMSGNGIDFQQGNMWRRLDPQVYIQKVSQYTPNGWAWITGSRLEAEKAVELLQKSIADRRDKIESIRNQASQYDEYLQKAREIEAQVKALADGYGYELRQFCKDYRLHSLSNAAYIWR